MDARTRLDGTRSRLVRRASNAMGRAIQRLSRRLVAVCTLLVLVTLAAPANSLQWGVSTALAKGPKPNHSPTTAASFQKALAAAKQQSPKWVRVPTQGPRVYSGLKPANALPSTGKVRNHAASVQLDAQFQKGHGGISNTIHWYKDAEGVLELGVPEGAIDLSGIKASPSTPSTPPSLTPGATPAATATATPGNPGATSRTPASTTTSPATPALGALSRQAPHIQQAEQIQTDTPPTYTLELEQTGGTFAGETMVLGTYDLEVVDDQGQPVEGAQLDEPVEVVFNYDTNEVDSLNPDSFMLSWPQTGDVDAAIAAAAVPVTMDAAAQTLTASVATLQPGPMVLSAGIADANQASSEHLTADPNQGDVSYDYPIDLPPAAGGLLPPLNLTYSSSGPNGRHSRQAPAPWVGDGWDLSLGSISADFTTGHYYLNGVGGVSEPLLCCMTDAAGFKYFVPHHHPEIRVYTNDNTTTPSSDSTTTGFTVLTPDGMEYRLGWHYGGSSNPYAVDDNARRNTVSGGVKRGYEWDVAEVVNRSSASGTNSYLQKYTVDYWHDNTTNSGITYQRDAALEEVDYNYDASGTAHARVVFNIHGPSGTLKTGGGVGTLTSYGTNYHCASSPYQSTTLRCDDPGSPSGWIAAPLTMTTLQLDQIVVQVDATGAGSWQTVRTYDLSYNADDPWKQCWDQMSGQQIGCSGEHLLHSVTETPYQGGTAEPSRQPMTFNYTGFTKNEYHDITVHDSSNNPYDAQSWWKYLNNFTDEQTGASATVHYGVAYGNTHGVPSGHNVDDPLTCDSVSCTNADDRQWPHQVVISITDNGNGTTTYYSYQLSETCGAGCTQDSWIPPNGWNACGDSGLPPHNPNQSCLTTGYANYYNEEYTGFLASTATHPDGSSTVTTYTAGGGWGTNDWDFANVDRGKVVSSVTYLGNPASTNPLKEVDNTYNGNANCPVTDSGTGNQLFQNPYLFCEVFQTKQVTSFYEGNPTGTTVPTLTQTWYYNPSPMGTNHYYISLLHTSITANDLAADSYGTTSTQPTFTTNYTYIYDDQMARSGSAPTSYLYRINLAAMTTLDDDQGTRWTCSRTEYDGQGYLYGQQNGLVDGLATQQDNYSDCGTSGNGYAMSGKVTTGTGYDRFGQKVVTTDADALASPAVPGHTGCTVATTPAVVYPAGASAYTTCTTYDSIQQTYATGQGNALNQQTAATYDYVQGMQTSSTDANGQITQTPAPTYEYNGTVSLSNYLDTYEDTKLPSESGSWTTRTFLYSFCMYGGSFITGTAPCLEADTVQRVSGSNLSVKREFYDREGRLVETRSSGPDSNQDAVTITSYDDLHDKSFSSITCTVAALTPSNGGRASSTSGYTAPAARPSGSGAYVDPTVSGTSCYNVAGSVTYKDSLGRTLATDDAMGTGAGTSGTGCVGSDGNGGTTHHTTCTYYQVAQASTGYGMPAADTAVYARTVTIDANLNQSASYADANGKIAYNLAFTGSGQTPLASGVSWYATTANQYDPTGTLRVITQPTGAQTTYTYDRLGRKTGMADPDLGTWSYTYDANGNLTSSTDPRGSGGGGVVYSAYDGLNRQLWRSTASDGSSPYASYTYDSTAGGNFGVGRLTGESFTGGGSGHPLSGSYAYTYDTRGQQTQVTTTVGGNSYPLSYGYDDAGHQTSLTYSDGEVLSTTYSSTGWVNAVSTTPSGGSQINLLTGITYGGPALELTGGTEGSGSTSYAASYDNDGRVTSAQLIRTSDSAILFNSARTYDAQGNVITVATTLPDGTDNQAFCYDALNRLTWAGSTGTPSCGGTLTSGTLTSAQYTQTFTYDTRNRLTNTSSSGATGSSPGAYTYGDSAHLDAATATAGGYGATYDAAGDLTCRAPTSTTTCAGGSPTGATLGYDAERRLTYFLSDHNAPPAVAAWDLYDGEGQRVEQDESLSGGTPSATYYLRGGVEEVHADGSLVKYYTAGGMSFGLNTAHDASGITFTGDDGLGSVQLALNSSGLAVASQLFSPYGSVRYSSGTMPTAKGFTGQYSDAATTGLDYYGARYYDPLLGQFTSADDQQGPNRYGYVTGNPETITDPTGQDLLGSLVQAATSVGNTIVSAGQAAAPAAVAVLDATTGIPSMINDVQTIFSGNASTMDKILAGADLALNVAMDVSMVVGVGEGARAAYMGAKIAGHVAMDVAEHVGEDELEHVGADALEKAGEDALEHGGDACALSFAASTLVATPRGERAISSLQVGDSVKAYDPATGKPSTQTVEATYINHDTDLLDVTLHPTVSAASETGSASQKRNGAHSGTTGKRATAKADKGTSGSNNGETIHTTASHPWLTTDHGWLPAGFLRIGETVRQVDGSTATVVAVRIVPGAAYMWDLTVSNVHDFAVGTGQFVVHNCEDGELVDAPEGWQGTHYKTLTGSEYTTYDHLDSGLQTTLKDGDLRVSWTNDLQSVRQHLPGLVNYLGDKVTSVSADLSDNLLRHAQVNRAAIGRYFRGMLEGSGFAGSSIDRPGGIELRYLRIS